MVEGGDDFPDDLDTVERNLPDWRCFVFFCRCVWEDGKLLDTKPLGDHNTSENRPGLLLWWFGVRIESSFRWNCCLEPTAIMRLDDLEIFLKTKGWTFAWVVFE